MAAPGGPISPVVAQFSAFRSPFGDVYTVRCEDWQLLPVCSVKYPDAGVDIGLRSN